MSDATQPRISLDTTPDLGNLLEATAAAKAAAIGHLICLFSEEGKGSRIIGTGLFAEYKGLHYVISAGHVLGNTDSIGPYSGPRTRLILGRRVTTWDEAGATSSDTRHGSLDLGVAEVPDAFAPPGKAPYTVDGGAVLPDAEWQRVWVAGFPSAGMLVALDGIEATLFHYNTREVSVRWAAWDPYETDQHLALEFPARGNVNENRETIDLENIDLRGMSGSPVWGLREVSSAVPGGPQKVWEARLIGILQAVEKKEALRYLVATRAATLISVLPILLRKGDSPT